MPMQHLPARRFIKWTQETFAAGGHKAELLPLLERCTCELQGEERYRNDVRYLRVWVQYVSGAGGKSGLGRATAADSYFGPTSFARHASWHCLLLLPCILGRLPA